MNKAQRKGNKRDIPGFLKDSRDKTDEPGIARAGTDSTDSTDSKDKSRRHGSQRGAGRDAGQLQEHGRGASGRGRFELMQYIHGFIACVLVLLALIHIPFPEPFAWLPYSVAAALALITLKSEISIPVSRVLAIATTGMMFFFFALFFLVVPTLKANWYTTQYGWAAVCLLLSAFVMIPILSDYSCRLKAPCREARAARRTAFFSVPSHINPESR